MSQTSNTGGGTGGSVSGATSSSGQHLQQQQQQQSCQPSGQCCENGRPIMTDPVSGQTVCSCQYDSARLALSASYSRGVYGTAYPSNDQNPYPSIGMDSSAFYSPLVSRVFTQIGLLFFHSLLLLTIEWCAYL